MVLLPWNFFEAGTLKSLVLRIIKVIACWKQSLMGHSDENLENKNARKTQTIEPWLMKSLEVGFGA